MGLLYGALTASILFCQGLAFKVYALHGGKKRVSSELINLGNFAICVLILVPVALLSGSFDITSVLYGLVQGILFWTLITFYGKAVSTGKIAFCNFIMAMTMIFPIIYAGISSVVVEPFTVITIIGLVTFGVAAYLVCFGEKGDGKKVSKSSYIFILISGTFSGVQSIWIKYTAAVYPEVNQYYVLATAFIVSLVLGGAIQIVKLVMHKRSACNAVADSSSTAEPTLVGNSMVSADSVAGTEDKIIVKNAIICTLVVGLATAIGNICFNVFAIMVNGATFYPMANGLSMLLAVALSPLFKEKVTVMQLIGIFIGVAAIILLSL